MLNKKISVNDIRAGMILTADAINAANEVIVPRSTVLSLRYKTRLINAGIKEISVNIPDYIATNEELTESAVYENRLTLTPEYKEFRRALLSIAAKLSETFDNIMIDPHRPVDPEPLIDAVNSLAEKYGNTLYLLELLQSSRDFDDLIYVHCVSVALISRIIGMKAHFTEPQVHDLLMASLFHDIGKITISNYILSKPGKLDDDEYEEVKGHALAGYKLLEETSLPEFVKLAALHHHERYDGTGYPDGLKGQKIPFYARYVAIADVYDAMTSKRVYREGICPFLVIEEFEAEGLQKYDAAGLLPFIDALAQSQIGSHVLLSNGAEGKVIMLSERVTRPIVKVGPDFLDLMRYPDLKIVKLL